jgi:hypothetical protein
LHASSAGCGETRPPRILPWDKHGNLFISYRGNYYEAALALQKTLCGGQAFPEGRLLPPASLCEDGEILTPADFYALVEDLRQAMAECNALVILNSPNYQDSYFTQSEASPYRPACCCLEIFLMRSETACPGSTGAIAG